MSPLVAAALATWDWRPSVLLVTLACAALFAGGWVRLRRLGRAGLASWRRLVTYALGLLVLLAALLSFIDVYSSLLLYVHMIQHMLLLMFAPGLLLWSDPFPVMLWALPRRARNAVTRHLQSGAAARRWLRRATPMGVLYALYVGVIALWHDANLYNRAQSDSFLHDAEHVSFFGAALLFWWPIFAAGPRIHGHVSPVGKMAALLLCVPLHVIIGAYLSFADAPVYAFYETVPRVTRLSVMEDQGLAGVIMWIPSSMMYLLGVVILLARHLAALERRRRPAAGRPIA